MNSEELVAARRNYVTNRNNPDVPPITATAIIRLTQLNDFFRECARVGADAVRINLIRFDLREDTPPNDPVIKTSNGVLSQVSVAFEPVKVRDFDNWIVETRADGKNILCVCPPAGDGRETGLCPPKCSGDEDVPGFPP